MRFLDYVSPSGNNLIAEWYCDISVEARAMFDALLDVLSKKTEWTAPEFKRLRGGLGEIRWKCDGRQHRIIGCWQKEPPGFWLLIGCTHKQNIYNPPDAIATAGKRLKGILNERKGRVERHESPEDCSAEG